MKFCGIKGNAQVFDILAEIVETVGNIEDQRRLSKSLQAEIREVDEGECCVAYGCDVM